MPEARSPARQPILHSTAAQAPSFPPSSSVGGWIYSLSLSVSSPCCIRMTWNPYEKSSIQRSSQNYTKVSEPGNPTTWPVLQKGAPSAAQCPGDPLTPPSEPWLRGGTAGSEPCHCCPTHQTSDSQTLKAWQVLVWCYQHDHTHSMTQSRLLRGNPKV